MMITELQQDQTALPTIDTAQAADSLCARLVQTTAELVSVLDRETSLLGRARASDIAGLTVHKSALSTTLVRDMQIFSMNAGFIASAAPERIGTLRENYRAFQQSLAANQRALAAVKAVSESLLRTIAEKAQEAQSGPETYGKDAGSVARKATRPTAIAVDKSL